MLFVLICLPFLPSAMTQTTEIVDNAVYGDPEIQCHVDSVKVNFNTQNVFEGHLYVRDHYDVAGCRVDATNERKVSLQIPFSSCGVRRERSVDPAGLVIITNVVISFHPMFVTKVDRSYSVRCFYMSADLPVTHNLDVSVFSTQLLTQSVPLPVCRYEVLDRSSAGSPLKYAVVGQDIYHKWTCDSPAKDIYCMTVHSCFVDDGLGRKVLLLDENGCAQDKYLMNNLYYEHDLEGGVSSMVFKYADKPTVFFQCQIRLHNKEDAYRCLRSSDVCPWPTRGKRHAMELNETVRVDRDVVEKMEYLEVQKSMADNTDVFSNSLTVLDIEDKALGEALAGQRNFAESENWRNFSLENKNVVRSRSAAHFCVDRHAFGLVFTIFASLIVLTSLLSFYLYLKSRKGFSKF